LPYTSWGGAHGTGPRGIFKVDVFMNGWPWGTWTAPDHIAPGTWPHQNYLVPFRSGLPDGVYDLEVRTYDDLGTMGVSAPIQVTKGAPCSDASTCADGQQCEDGKCFWDQPTGVLGDTCAVDQECLGPSVYDGQCVTDSAGTSLCTHECNSGSLDNCEDGFYCLETNATERTGVCWPAEEDTGCCSVGDGDSRQLIGMFGLMAIAGLVLGRRRSR
jgi:MYXO-CTERM domain-containing protein